MIIELKSGIFHSHPNVFFKGNDLKIEVAVNHNYKGNYNFHLSYTTLGHTSTAEMLPETNISGNAVYSTVIPKDALSGISVLDYSISDGPFTLFDYEVPVVEPPVCPPVIITELYPRPARKRFTRYLELTNISDKKVDLYNYRLSIEIDGVEKTAFITDTPNEIYIAPKETLVLRFLTKDSFDSDKNIIESKEEYLSNIYNQNPYRRLEVLDTNVVDIDITRVSPKTGELENDPTKFALSPVFSQNKIVLSSRNGERDENYTELYINTSPLELDVLNSRAILTSIDSKDPSKTRVVMRGADATPGILDSRVPVPNYSNISVPNIILTSPTTAHLMSDGDLTIEYSVQNGAAFSYLELYSDGQVKKYIAEKLSDTDYRITLGKSTVIKHKNINVAIFADNGTVMSSLGDAERPLSIHIVDNVGPTVSMISPKPNFCYSGEYTPTISGSVYDASGINIASCRIAIDDMDITDDVEWNEYTFSFTPKKELSEGEHKIRFKLFDLLGNVSKISSPFMIAPESEMNCYFGEIHNHTVESDGMGTPEESIIYARDVVGMDFYAPTEHSHYMVDDKYQRQIELANSYNVPGSFAALYGWEMTWTNASGWWGHLNVIGSNSIIVDKDNYSLGMLCDWLETNGGIGMLNHPGYPWGNFNEYAMPADISNKNICLAEIKGSAYDREYAHMLKKGYYISPVYNDDAHSKTWGNNNNFTGYVLAPYLSRENVLDAFRKRRTYSTSDRTLKLKYSINGKWLGSILENPEELNVNIEISTESEAGIGKIQLVTENSIVVKEINVGARQNYTWNFTIDPLHSFYYVRLVGIDKYTVTSPIWITGNDALKISELKLDSSANELKPITINFDLTNTTEETLSGVRSDIYISPLSGVVYGDLPYLTVYTDKLKPGASASISRTIPSIPSNRLVTVISSAKKKNKNVLASDAVNATQILIAEIMPSTTAVSAEVNGETVEISNPYAYVKLFNNSCKDYTFSGSALRLWKTTGKAPNENTTVDISGVTIKSRSTLVVWQRKASSPLTVADFNRHYQTELIEGTDIIVTDKTIVTTGTAGALIDVISGNDVLSRANYNYCREEMDNEIVENHSFHYVYAPNFTASASRISGKNSPKPDCVYAIQKTPFTSGEPTSKELKSEKKADKKAEKEQTTAKSSNAATGLSLIGGMTAAGAIVGTALSRPRKVVVKTEPTVLKPDAKAQKKSEKRVVKGVSKEIGKKLDKQLDKKINKAQGSAITSQMNQDKQTIKQAKKNIKTLKMRQKAEKAAQKREKELKKLRGY